MTLQDLSWALKEFQLDNTMILHHYSIDIKEDHFDVEFVTDWGTRRKFTVPANFNGNLVETFFEPTLTLLEKD